MQIFESNDKNMVSTTKSNYRETLGLKCFFLKIDKFEGPKSHSPLKKIRPIFLVLK